MIELAIDAFDEFTCIGDLCEDHCCKGWSVIIDKDTHEVYEKVKDAKFKDKFNVGVSKLKKGSRNNFSVMNLNGEGNCYFLDENQLCEIYKTLGSDKMSYTCRTYPRQIIQVGSVIQKTLALSCPEASRKILFREEPIEFNIEETQTRHKVAKIYSMKDKGLFSNDLFLELRSFMIDILQNRSYSIEERLMILGLFIEDISGKTEDEVVDIANSYINGIVNGVYSGVCKGLDRNTMVEAQAGYCVKAYNKVLSQFNNESQRQNIISIKEGLSIHEGIDFEELEKNYMSVKENYYNDCVGKYDYVFENYLVNYAFKNALMLSKENLFSQYAEMVIYYSMIRFGIIGVCGYIKDGIDENRLNSLITTFARGVDHSIRSVKGLKELSDEFKEKGLVGLIPLILI